MYAPLICAPNRVRSLLDGRAKSQTLTCLIAITIERYSLRALGNYLTIWNSIAHNDGAYHTPDVSVDTSRYWGYRNIGWRFFFFCLVFQTDIRLGILEKNRLLFFGIRTVSVPNFKSYRLIIPRQQFDILPQTSFGWYRLSGFYDISVFQYRFVVFNFKLSDIGKSYNIGSPLLYTLYNIRTFPMASGHCQLRIT